MPTEWLGHLENTVTYMYKNLQQTYWPPLCGKGFFDYEIKKMERIYVVCKEQINNADEAKIIKSRKDLILFIKQHDLRRGTNFLEVFPELENYYKQYTT